MAEETKKISFGFSKLKKPNVLVKPVEISKPQVDYVDSFDGAKGKFSYKGNVRCDEPVKKELVIPLVGTRTALDVIRSKLEENKKIQDKSDENDKGIEENETNGTVKPVAIVEEKKNVDAKQTEVKLSIDDLAAREIINELHNNAAEEKASSTMVIKQPNKVNIADEKDAPIDYENIPVNDFGLAMLRGMGWTPQTGIGKEQKVVQVVAPKLRPKGLGLGADKVVLQQSNKDSDLTISIKSYVKFLNGLHKGKYGQIESMDEDNGRVIVKLALGGSVSVSEMLLMPVTKKDYEKNSKVLNPTSYETFKEPEKQFEANVKSEAEKSSSDSRRKNRNDDDDDDNSHRKEKYDRRDRGRESDDSSSSERKKKKKRSRDDSTDRKYKKSKKKRKKRRRYSSDEESDSSSERRHDRERSRNHSHHSKSRKSSNR